MTIVFIGLNFLLVFSFLDVFVSFFVVQIKLNWIDFENKPYFFTRPSIIDLVDKFHMQIAY